MALKFYESVGSTTPYSVDGLFTNPQIVSIDGRMGGVIEKKLYLRNDDNTKTYSGIQMIFYQSGGDISYLNGTDGFSMKANVGNAKPTAAEWVTITHGSVSGTFSDINDTATYLPVWIRFQIPAKVLVQHINNVSLKITATESV